MTSTTSNLPSYYRVDKLNTDLQRLDHIGTIVSIELDLSKDQAISDSLLTYVQGTEGFYYISGTIFINYMETMAASIETFLELIYAEFGSLDMFDTILVHMISHTVGGELVYDVELSSDSVMPKIISVNQPSMYFQFLQSFRVSWMSVKI